MRYVVFILHFILGFSMIYLIGAFSKANINFVEWDFDYRLSVATIGTAVGFLADYFFINC